MSLWDKLRGRGRGGLRPTARSHSLVSIDHSLQTIAAGIKVIVLREYRVDLDAPPATRADRTREVFEPVYPDNLDEAVREERERLEALAEEAATGVQPANMSAGLTLGLTTPGSRMRGGEADEPLSKEEHEFLAELDGLEDR